MRKRKQKPSYLVASCRQNKFLLYREQVSEGQEKYPQISNEKVLGDTKIVCMLIQEYGI